MHKTVEHGHPNPIVMTDDELLDHVQEQHNVMSSQPWMLNEGNRMLLMERHAQAHTYDAISFKLG